jgi:WD40 repeat protein
MGCAQGKTIEEDRSKNNYGFPACRKSINLEKAVDSLVAHDPQQVYLGARDELQLLDLKTDSISCFSTEHKGRINVLIKLKDGRLASGGQDKLIKVWDINSKESLMTLEGHKSMVWALNEVSGNKLISGGSDKRALIWDLNEKKLDFELYNDKEITVVLQLKTGKVLVCSENNLCLFDLDSKQKLTSIEVKSGIWCIRELADGSVAIGEGNGNIAILEVGNDIKIKCELKGHKKAINSIIQLDNQKLVTCGDENNMILWDLKDPEAKYFIEGHTNKVSGLAHLGGNKFVSVSQDKTLKVWE